MANKIKYGDRELDMGDLTLEQAKALMARHFPELADPQVEKKEFKNDTIYTFTKKAGRKGNCDRSVAGGETGLIGSAIRRTGCSGQATADGSAGGATGS
jgi:PRTRC genetic system protein C